MISVSLCMIVKNEGDVLARCLDSVRDLVEEIIIVDTGSEDQTVEIAKAYTERVYHFSWIDDFSTARNESFSKASSDYILWLDADDILLEKDRAAFLALKRTLPPDVDLVMMKYNLAFDKDGNATFFCLRERLIRRAAGLRWIGPVHEVIPPVSKTVNAGHIAVSHFKIRPGDPERNLKIIEKYIASGGELDPRQTFYYGRELLDNGKTREAIKVLEEFFRDGRGWIENKIEACRNLSACYAAMGKAGESLEALFRSFHFDTPRAEVCCDIGKRFLELDRYPEAAFWYEQARGMKPKPDRGGFLLMECYGYIPCLQLCVCYDRMGMREKAKEMNELAAGFKPGDASVEYNRRYFSKFPACPQDVSIIVKQLENGQ